MSWSRQASARSAFTPAPKPLKKSRFDSKYRSSDGLGRLSFLQLHELPLGIRCVPIESYVSAISSAKRKNVTTVAQASGKIAPETPEISAPATSPSCLTKEYLATGAVLFKDACTEQWAINSTTVARHKPAGRACLSKEVSDDGIVIFRDSCTSEWAMNSSQNPADPPR